ncbi:MAG: transporter substrate-binding domain-containing protein [Halarcobacter sp.]
MKKQLFIFFSIFFLSFFYSSLFAKEQKSIFTKKELTWIKNNPIVTIAMIDNFPPFTYTNNGKHEGFSVDITKEIERISGLRFDYKLSKWSKALDSFKTGKVDMIADISFTKKREAFTLYSQVYYEIPTYIFGLKSDELYVDNTSLKNKTLAVSKNLFYIDSLKQLGYNIIEVGNSIEKAKAVITGRADYFISSYTSGVRVINENAYTTLKPLDELEGIKKEDLHFGINIDKPILQSIIKKSLHEINSRQMKRLANKWIINAQENKNIISLTQEELDYISDNPSITYSEVNWKPLSIIEDNKMKGIMGDYLELVSKRTGLNFKFIPASSWPDVLDKFKQKKIDLVPGIGSSPQERSLGLISNKYAKYPLVIVTTNKFTYIDGLNDLRDSVIAVPKYYTSYNFLVKNFPEIKIIPTKNILEALLLVENGKADAFVGHIASSLYYISELSLRDLKVSGVTQFDFEHHYLVQNDNPILLSIINKTFASITDQERKEIYSKWIQTSVVKETNNKKFIYIILFIFSIVVLAFLYRQHILKKYNKKLEETNSEIQSIINSTLEAIILSYENYCIDLNDSAQKMFKVKNKEDAIGKFILDYIDEKSLPLIKEKIKEEYTEPYEIDCIKFDGTVFPTLIKGTNIKMNNKTIRITSIIDISEIKNKEILLIEQSKMAAIGEMIGNIAHQWRQPLSAITTIASSWSIYDEYGTFDKKRVLDEASVILSNANYLSQTIDDFRLFIKGEKSTKQFDLESVSDNLFRLISSSIKSNQITLEKKLTSSKQIIGNPNELLQSLINIINNSIDAIKLNNQMDGVIFYEIEDKNDSVIIIISDNAGGIDEENLSNIFEPYFTTKHKYKGTGLGLYMTYNILNKFNATIKVKNKSVNFNDKKYLGASFIINLPTET